jgi:hypothetical protein
MYARWYDRGVRSPLLAGSARLDKVVSATIRCIEKNKAEVLINRPPLKPTVLFGTAFPGAMPRVLGMLGYTAAMEHASQVAE